MINSILAYLISNRTWLTGVNLFIKFGRNKSLLRKIQIQGETPSNFEALLYQLWKLTERPQSEFIKIINSPIASPPKQAPQVPKPEPGQPDKPKLSLNEKTQRRIRDKFPFLSEPDCPDVFKILVSNMITSYGKYINSHSELFDVTTNNQALSTAQSVIENYLDNRSIWDELQHYQDTRLTLGKHPIFAEIERKKELSSLPVHDLFKLRTNLEMNIWRNKKKIEDYPSHPNTKARQKRVEIYTNEIVIVNSLLNVNE